MKNNQKIRYCDEFRAMGTDVSVDLIGIKSQLAQNIFAQVRELFATRERVFSRFCTDSELSLLNAQLGKKVKISKLMCEAIARSLVAHHDTQGYFDPRVINTLEAIGYTKDFFADSPQKIGVFGELASLSAPIEDDIVFDEQNCAVMLHHRIDLAGIVKSMAVAAATDLIRGAGVEDFAVDAGGDMVVSGQCDDGPWYIGIEGVDDDEFLAEMSDEAMATSGITRRKWQIGGRDYHHLINPFAQNEFKSDILTVSVVDDDVVQADIWAKALFLMGENGSKFAQDNNIKAVFIDKNNRFYAAIHIKDKLV